MRQNTARIVDLAAVRRQRAQTQPQPQLLPMMMVWVPVWFFLPYPTKPF